MAIRDLLKVGPSAEPAVPPCEARTCDLRIKSPAMVHAINQGELTFLWNHAGDASVSFVYYREGVARCVAIG